MSYAIYLRVSSKGQGDDDRFGLPAQRAAIDKYVREHKLGDDAAVYVDRGFSGASADRPELMRLLGDAQAHAFDTVMVARWDRLARDVMLDGYLRHRLRENGVTVVSATETNGIDPISQMTQTILAAVAQYERSLIAQRLAGARRLKASRGGHAQGVAPFGKRYDGDALVDDPVEKPALDLAHKLRRMQQSYRQIGEALDAAGHPPRSGKTWSTSSVAAILSRSKRPKRAKVPA